MLRLKRSSALFVIAVWIYAHLAILPPARAGALKQPWQQPLAAAGTTTSLAAGSSFAKCQLTIRGDPTISSVQAASLQCTSGRITAALNQTVIGGFQQDFLGVYSHEDNCGNMPGCLITLCGNTKAVFANSSIVGVQDPSFGLAGGALLCIVGQSTVHLKGLSIANNTARGLLVTDRARVVLSDGSRIYNNSAAGPAASGAGLRAVGSCTVEVRNSSFVDNEAGLSGGGMAAGEAASVYLHSASFSANAALSGSGGGGGLVAFGRALVQMYASEFASNEGARGAGLWAAEEAVVAIHGANFVGHSGQSRVQGGAQEGGALAVHDSARLSLYAGNLAGNYNPQLKRGGAVYAGGNSSVLLHGTNLAGNGAKMAGGAVAAFGNAVLRLEACNLAGNSVLEGSGGGLVAGGASVVVIEGTDWAGNEARSGGAGGGLAAFDEATVSIMGSQFAGNNAAGWGGGLAAFARTTLAINGTNISGNMAGKSGGGLAVLGRSKASIHGSNFAGNDAAGVAKKGTTHEEQFYSASVGGISSSGPLLAGIQAL